MCVVSHELVANDPFTVIPTLNKPKDLHYFNTCLSVNLFVLENFLILETFLLYDWFLE